MIKVYSMEAREEERRRIAKATEEYFKKGGTVEDVNGRPPVYWTKYLFSVKGHRGAEDGIQD